MGGGGGGSVSFLYIVNRNKRADIGGLQSLFRDCQPHLAFLQEVASVPYLTSLAFEPTPYKQTNPRRGQGKCVTEYTEANKLA